MRDGVQEFMRFMNEALEEHFVRKRDEGSAVTVFRSK
jgi:hypothetical protein